MRPNSFTGNQVCFGSRSETLFTINPDASIGKEVYDVLAGVTEAHLEF